MQATRTTIASGLAWLAASILTLTGAAMAQGQAQTQPQSAAVLLEKGIYSEETAGDIDAAIKIYRQVLEEQKASAKYAAMAQCHLGTSYLKQGKKQDAQAALQIVIDRYPDQTEAVSRANRELAKIEPPNRPKALSTTPASLSNDVDPSLDKITVTFDTEMMDRSWAWTTDNNGRETFPKLIGDPSYDQARKTCTITVKLQPGKVYWVGINGGRYTSFQTLARIPAQPYAILFATKADDGKPTPLPEALVKEAKAINAGGSAEDIKSRYVGKTIAAFAKETDLSTPESACAAWHRASVATDTKALAELSWRKLDPGEMERLKKADPADIAAYNKAQADAEILMVLTYRDELAQVITYLPFAPGQGRNPYSCRSFGLIGGQWKNIGEDRLPTLQDARQNFLAKKVAMWDFWQDLKSQAEADNRKAAVAAKAVKEAEPVATEWLKLVDNGKFAGSFDAAAGTFRNTTTKADWQATMKAAAARLGKVKSRKSVSADHRASLPQLPDAEYAVLQYEPQPSSPGAFAGEYVVFQHEASFENKQAVETVVVMKDTGGTWRVSAYVIRIK